MKEAIADIFNSNNGRIPHFERLLCWFPDYLVKYHALTTTLFFGIGPIPIDQRYFIAIMVNFPYLRKTTIISSCSFYSKIIGNFEFRMRVFAL